MNQFLTGKLTPPAKTIWQILKLEGYELADCVFLPDHAESLSKKHLVITKRLHEILDQEGNVPATVSAAIDAWHRQIQADKKSAEGSKSGRKPRQ